MVILFVNFWRSVIIAELWRPEVTRRGNSFSNFCIFWKKTLYCKIFKKYCSGSFFASPIDVVVLKCRKKFSNRKSAKLCVIYWTIKQNLISAPSQTVANARIAPKICYCQPPTFGSHRFRFHPNWFPFRGVIAKCVKAVLLSHRVFAWYALRADNIISVLSVHPGHVVWCATCVAD